MRDMAENKFGEMVCGVGEASPYAAISHIAPYGPCSAMWEIRRYPLVLQGVFRVFAGKQSPLSALGIDLCP